MQHYLRRWILVSVCVIGLLWARPAEAINVAVYGAPATSAWNNDVQTKLQATGLFTLVDVVNANTTTLTLAQLLAYDAVLVYSDGGFQNAVAQGDALGDYVDQGKGVVMCAFSFAS